MDAAYGEGRSDVRDLTWGSPLVFRARLARTKTLRMPDPLGYRRWAIAEGHIPGLSTGSEPALESHETVCILNASEDDAHVDILIFFSDREPAGPYVLTVPARRTVHVRFNDLDDPEPIPRDTDYASTVTSDVPIVVQHSRLDSRQANLALLSTIAYAGD